MIKIRNGIKIVYFTTKFYQEKEKFLDMQKLENAQQHQTISFQDKKRWNTSLFGQEFKIQNSNNERCYFNYNAGRIRLCFSGFL